VLALAQDQLKVNDDSNVSARPSLLVRSTETNDMWQKLNRRSSRLAFQHGLSELQFLWVKALFQWESKDAARLERWAQSSHRVLKGYEKYNSGGIVF
jgi:hypothetical protein